VSEGLEPYKDVESWLMGGGDAWRLMALRWFNPAAITKDDYLKAAQSEPLSRILSHDSFKKEIGGKSRYYRDKYTGLAYRLQLMADFGANRNIPGIEESVDDFLVWGSNPGGGLTYAKGLPSFPCFSGTILGSMVRMGYTEADPKAKELGDWIAAQMRSDGGWLCPPRMMSFVIDETHSCFSATYYATAGLVALNSSDEKQKIARESGLEFLLNHKLFRSDRSDRILCNRWLETGFPSFNYYSLLKGANLIATAGLADDPRADEAFDILLKQRQEDGSWLQGWIPSQPKPYDCTEKGKPCRGVTILTWSTLASAGRLAPPQIN
jgi:hypothetical protein